MHSDRSSDDSDRGDRTVKSSIFVKAQEEFMISVPRAVTLPSDARHLRQAANCPGNFRADERPHCGGMWLRKQMIGFVLGSTLFLIFVVFRPAHTIYINANRMCGVTLLIGVFWICEVMPVYVTALLPLILLPVLGITSTAVVANAYWNPIQLLVVGTYLVDIALEQVCLPQRVALKMLTLVGRVNPAAVLLAIMGITWFLSMFNNNIAVAFMVVPFAISLLNASEEYARDNAISSSDIEIDEVGSDSEESEGDPVEQRVTRVLSEVHRYSAGVLLGIAFASNAGGIATMTGCVPNQILLGVGTLADEISYSHWFRFALPTSVVTFLLAYGIIWFQYVRGAKVRALNQLVVDGQVEEFQAEHGPASRDEYVVGILQAIQFTLLITRRFWAHILAGFSTMPTEMLFGDATAAMLPAVFLFLIPSSVRKGESVITWPHVHDKFDFGLILLIGGGFAIASGFKESGLDAAIGDWIGDLLKNGDGAKFWEVCQVVVATAFSAQIFSAVGTATTILPALQSGAQMALVNPLNLMLPATVACSLAFAFPTAAPANVVVLAKSQELAKPLSVRNFVRTGVPLNIVATIVAAYLLQFMVAREFDTQGPYPKWACDGLLCIWANVSGEVRGRFVDNQACVIDDHVAMVNCRLANGTIMAVDQVMPANPFMR